MASESAVELLVSDWHMERQSARFYVARAHSEGVAVDTRTNALVKWSAQRGFEVLDTPAGIFLA